MQTIQDYKKEYDQLRTKKNLLGKEALEAVKQNGYALRYVESNIFKYNEDDIIIGLNGKKYKLIN